MYRYSFKHLNTGTCSNYKFRKNLCFPIKYEQVTSHGLVLHNFNLYTCKTSLMAVCFQYICISLDT